MDGDQWIGSVGDLGPVGAHLSEVAELDSSDLRDTSFEARKRDPEGCKVHQRNFIKIEVYILSAQRIDVMSLLSNIFIIILIARIVR